MKKKRYPLLPALAVVALMLIPIRGAAQVFNPYSVSYTATYSNDNLTIGTDTLDGVVYSTVSYNDLYNDGEPGMPSLPVDFLKFSVPYNATDFTVSVNTRMWHTQTLDHLVYPSQMPWLLDGSPAPPAMLPDSAAYYSGNYYPSQMAWVADEGFLAGENHIVTVAVLPFRYTHTASTNQLSMVRRCGITLRYRLSDSLAMQPIVRNDSLLREEGYNLVQTMVVNPNSVKSYAPTLNTSLIDSIGYMHGIGGDVINGGGYAGGDGPGPVNPSLPDPGVDTTGIGTELYLDEINYNYPYLIVTTPELKHAVRRIAALKRQKGYNVKIVTMDEVMQDTIARRGDFVNGHIAYNDPAGVLRQYIRGYFRRNGTQYVLLAGDVPYRYTKLRTTEFNNDSIILPSDMYYADINGDWYYNDYDYYSELYVGRLLAKTTDQITNYTDKLFRYQFNPGNGNPEYLTKAIYSQGYDFIKSGELFQVQRTFNTLYNNPFVLSESEEIDDKSKHPSGEDIIESINATQYGFISLHHHGFPAGLLTYGFRERAVHDYFRFLWAIDTVHTFNDLPDRASDDPSVRNGLNNLTNKWYPSICYASSCVTMPFDVIPGYETIPMNFGESYTTGKDYGGPIFIGNTRKGVTPYTAFLERNLGNSINKGYYQIGVANSLAKFSSSVSPTDTIGNRYTVMNQNLLGDPELEIWTDIPEQFTGIEITRTDQNVLISGISLDTTIVAYMQKNYLMRKLAISDSTVLLDDASPNSPIMLYKHNHIPYIAPLLLQNERFKTSKCIIAYDVAAGNFVDSNRLRGDVIIVDGVECEIEAAGTVRLEDGFKVEKGATFAVYPSCF